MRIAVTYEDGNIFQHFGKTAQFKIYDVEEQRMLSRRQRSHFAQELQVILIKR